VALWILAPLLIGWSGVFPFRCHPVLFFALHALVAATRWAGSRIAYGIPLHPYDDLVRATYDVPGSLFALPSALTRRIRPLRQPFPVQPLLWASVLLTVVTTISLVDRSATSDGRIDAVVGVAIIDLVALWVVAIRAVGTRAWDRTSYRIPVDLPAVVDGHRGVTIDASPVGLAVAGHLEHLDAGSNVTVSVEFETGTTLDLPAVVADHRHGAGVDVVGLALHAEGDLRAQWIRELFGAVGVVGGAGRRRPVALPKGPRLPHATRETAGTARRAVERLQIGIVAATSLAVVGALVAVFLGYAPLVVRSGSMKPAIAVGDVAVMDWVRVSDIAPGDVVSFHRPDEGAHDDVVTHRVRDVDPRDGVVDVETRGDANTQSEFWSVPANTLVGRMAFKIPKVGLVAIALGREAVRATLLVVALALAGAVAVVLLVRSRARVPT
jgi:signal peptidase I